MRKSILLFVTLCIFSSPVLAQITISNNFMPPPGTVLQFHQDLLADSALFALMTSGSGGPMLWDFSARTYGAGYDLNVVNIGSTPGIDSFPNANLALLLATGVDTTWSIMHSDPGIFEREGSVTHSGDGEAIVVYRGIAPDWLFPLAFNNQWTSYRHWTQYYAPFRTEIADTTFNTVDAWGTVQYQANSVPCLRVMAHERFTYNTYDGSGHLIFTNSFEIFTANFVAAGFNSPVTISKSVQPSMTSYSSVASGDFLNGPSGVPAENLLPEKFKIAQNYPNPFNSATTISYSLSGSSDVTLDIFDVLGRKIETLINGPQDAGIHRAIWDADGVPSGVYFYRIKAGDQTATKMMTLLK